MFSTNTGKKRLQKLPVIEFPALAKRVAKTSLVPRHILGRSLISEILWVIYQAY
jgi:hypothetical protein